MARPLRVSSSWTRLLNPAYFLRRPQRLLLLCFLIMCFTYLLCDRHSLVSKHEDELSEFEANYVKLRQKGEDLVKILQETREYSHVDNTITKYRQKRVKKAMLHAWSSYEKYAWGFDELMPQSKRGSNQFGGLGATIVDSLDTLYIMGLMTEFRKARDWVEENLHFDRDYDASVFETTIRVLGGLLSSFDLTNDYMFLSKAKDLADRLLPAWNTRTGIPYNTINLQSGRAYNPGWIGVFFDSHPYGSSTLADLGTEQMEFIGLSQRTGDPIYRQKVEHVIKQLKNAIRDDGLLPIFINPDSGQPTTGQITFGAMGDSFYEYLLKVWIQGNQTETVKHYREMWDHSMEGMMGLIQNKNRSIYTYIADRSGTSLNHKMDELACFLPGMLTLGTVGATPAKAKQYLTLAEKLAFTCYNFYMSTPTKLSAETYRFSEEKDMEVETSYSILRPETIESLMYLWRKTGKSQYREWGWDIFQAFENQSRTPSGYVGLKDVNSGEKDDRMQSFFLAETLKYLYLLFSPSSLIPLDEWVFNTEAHPLRIIPRMNEPVSLEDDELAY